MIVVIDPVEATPAEAPDHIIIWDYDPIDASITINTGMSACPCAPRV